MAAPAKKDGFVILLLVGLGLSIAILICGLLMKYWWLALTALGIGLVVAVIGIAVVAGAKRPAAPQNAADGFMVYSAPQPEQTPDNVVIRSALPPFLFHQVVLAIEIVTIVVLLLVFFRVI